MLKDLCIFADGASDLRFPGLLEGASTNGFSSTLSFAGVRRAVLTGLGGIDSCLIIDFVFFGVVTVTGRSAANMTA